MDAESPEAAGRSPLYERLVGQLGAFVRESGLRAGDRLPSERDLAERLGVSRNSLKQATTVLQVQGLVEIRHGGGTYLLHDTLATEPLGVLLDRRQRLPDVLDAREALETKLAELAATRRTDDDLARMAEALSEMARAIKDGERGDDGDRRFHEAVVAAARSRLLAGFYRQLTPLIVETRLESLRQPGRPRQSLAQHTRVLEAIRAGDARRAATAMRRHVRTVARVRLLAWQPGAPTPG